jgi:hypothetical protein
MQTQTEILAAIDTLEGIIRQIPAAELHGAHARVLFADRARLLALVRS